MRALIVEDDPMIGESLSRGLSDRGMAVDWIRNGGDAIEALATIEYGVVLLDLGLPDMSGLDVLTAMRERKNATPVLIISARDEFETRVAGLDLGADDYVVKPFDFQELTARIRAVKRRHAGQTRSRIECGEITFDLASHEVTYRGVSHVLPTWEFALLQALTERPGMILSRSQLEDRLYGWGNEVESNAVEVLIHYIRKKLGRDVIRNVPLALFDLHAHGFPRRAIINFHPPKEHHGGV